MTRDSSMMKYEKFVNKNRLLSMDDLINEISDDDAMRILNDISWDDNNEINNDGDNVSSNDVNDDSGKQNITTNAIIIEDDMMAILDSIKNEKANDRIYTNVDGNKKILIKDKNVEFQIDLETLMKWNADCASCIDDENEDANANNKTDYIISNKNDDDNSNNPKHDSITTTTNDNDNVYDNKIEDDNNKINITNITNI